MITFPPQHKILNTAANDWYCAVCGQKWFPRGLAKMGCKFPKKFDSGGQKHKKSFVSTVLLKRKKNILRRNDIAFTLSYPFDI